MSDTLEDWLPRLLSIPASSVNNAIWEWASPVNRDRFKRWYGRLERVVAWKSTATGKQAKIDSGRRSAVIGRVYEKVLRILFEGGGALSFVKNIRTTTSEIDLLLKIEPVAVALPIFARAGTHLIGEAKCHKKPPKSELINEFAGFLLLQHATLGLLFVFSKSQALGVPCRMAIALHERGGLSIVPVGRKQLEQVLGGAPFLKVLSEQYVTAKNHSTKLAI